MLIKVGNVTVLNMSVVYAVHLQASRTEKVVKGKWFDKKVEGDPEYRVEIVYKDPDERQRQQFNLTGIRSLEEATKIRDEILTQAKELEANSLTSALENAIRNS